jgi:beta-galactosidase
MNCRRAAYVLIGLMLSMVGAATEAPPARGAAPRFLEVDATAVSPPPETGYFKTGTSRGPHGDLGINSRYLTLDGQPWLPVMGEFHYSRFPAQYWDEEIAKMRAAGVDIVATYVIWNHHQEVPGPFVWSGDRDLRRFVELCARHGLKVFVRLGPWDHAEARLGGIPDWVARSVPTRGNDPTYLRYVAKLYEEIGAQLHGLLWKDGGPVIGVQLENEYNLTGPGRGREHIATLKQLALAAGFDVPYYTVTGWDGTTFPEHEVTPVFGGYPDEPWDTSAKQLSPREPYLFRFLSRVTGNLGAQTQGKGRGDAETDTAHTPFLGAEFGGGVPIMYRRRPLIAPDDIAAMLPVQLGSGVNLYGYYMFHGGQNPLGRTTLEENTETGSFNDVPLLNYDFQAPLGQYGQANEVLSKIRPFHYFLQEFGPQLAPMSVHAPVRLPAAADDLATPRYSVRSAGDSGFLFFNNHVRQFPMQAQTQVRFLVHLPHGDLTFPSRPIDLPTDAYFIWSFNVDLAGAHLVYATAQPMGRVGSAKHPVYVFRAVPKVPVEFAFDAGTVVAVSAPTGQVATDAKSQRILVSALTPGSGALMQATLRSGTKVQFLVLTEAEAEQSWFVKSGDGVSLLLTKGSLFSIDGHTVIRSRGDPSFRLSIFPTPGSTLTGSLPLRREAPDAVFAVFSARAVARTFTPRATPLRPAGTAPPIRIGGPANAAVAPYPEVYGVSAAWTIDVSPASLEGLSDAFLQIHYQGDVARLFAGPDLIDDQFFYGPEWEIGLKRFAQQIKNPLVLTVLPLRRDAPVYFEGASQLPYSPEGQIAALTRVSIVPEYELTLRPPTQH